MVEAFFVRKLDQERYHPSHLLSQICQQSAGGGPSRSRPPPCDLPLSCQVGTGSRDELDGLGVLTSIL